MKFISKLLPAIKTKLVIPVLSVLVLAIISYVTFEVTKAEVTVINDGESIEIRTHADTVEEVLAEANIEPGKFDDLSHQTDELITSGMEIEYKKAIRVTVSIDGRNKDYYTTKETVGELLKEQNIEFTKHDDLQIDKEEALKPDLIIKANKAFQVTLNEGGKEEKIWTTGGTVEDLLDEKDVTLGELDRIEPKVTEAVDKDTIVNITRVEKVTDIVEETKEYSVVRKKDSSLKKGTEKVVSSGENGIIAKHYEVTLENGEEVDRELIKEEVTKESQEKVVAVGTKEVNYTVSRGDDGEVVKEFYMTATVYTEKCNGCRGITYTGIDLRNNPDKKVVAVDPSVIPLGSRVWVEGYGYAIAGDTGGAIKGNRIDLFIHSSKYNGGYGHKKVKVKVYE